MSARPVDLETRLAQRDEKIMAEIKRIISSEIALLASQLQNSSLQHNNLVLLKFEEFNSKLQANAHAVELEHQRTEKLFQYSDDTRKFVATMDGLMKEFAKREAQCQLHQAAMNEQAREIVGLRQMFANTQAERKGFAKPWVIIAGVLTAGAAAGAIVFGVLNQVRHP